MATTTSTSRCARCSGDVVYVTTASQGLWQHTAAYPVHHQPEPLQHLTGAALDALLDEARAARVAAAQAMVGANTADNAAAYHEATERYYLFENERLRRVFAAAREDA